MLILNYLQTAVSGTCTAFAPSFPVYCTFRLLSGMSLAGIVINSMTLSKRPSPSLPVPRHPLLGLPPSLRP